MNSIPEVKDPEAYSSAKFEDCEFVKIHTNESFDVQMQYPVLGMETAEEDCYVRKTVFEKLRKAQSLLPPGYKIRIWDAWRPFALQRELYETYSESIICRFQLEQASKEQKEKRIRKFVSKPIEDRDMPPVHTTGGAVDVTLINEKGIELEMGTIFDEFSDATRTAYFESNHNELVRENRRLLYYVMSQAGFTNLPSEWWHYDYGDHFWAFYHELPAIYRGVFTKEELNG